MNWGLQRTKYLLYVYNFILAICGLSVLIVGAVARANSAQIAGDGAIAVASGADTIIVFGCLIFIGAFFGVWGAMRENHCMVLLYSVGLAVLMVVQIGMGISVLVQTRRGGSMSLSLDIQYPIVFRSYTHDSLIAMSIDSIQSGLTCCGIDGPTDFIKLGHHIPGSCCRNLSTDSCTVMESFPVGCLTQLKNIIVQSGTTFGAVAIALAVYEVIGIICGLVMADTTKKIQKASRAGQVYARGM